MLQSEYNGHKVSLIESVEEFDLIKSILSEKVSVGVDCETEGLSQISHRVVGVCIAAGTSYRKQDYQGFYLPIRHQFYDKNLPVDKVIEFTQFIVDNYKTCWWNRNFDFTMLEKDGFVAPFVGKTHDGQCMAHLVKGESFPALKAYAETYLKYNVIEFSDNKAKDNNFGNTDPRVTYVYASQDPIVTTLLSKKLWVDYPYIRKIYPIDNKFAEALRKFCNTTDLYLDKDLLQSLYDKNMQELNEVKKEIFAFTGYTFQLNSNRDKADALSRYVTLTEKTAKGAYTVKDEALAKIDHPLARMFQKYAELEKFRGTYLEKMLHFSNPFHVNYHHCNVSCLTENNKVRTLRGIKSIKDVILDDYVLSENGFYPVIDKASFEDEVVRVNFRNGTFIEGNKKHPVLVNGEWKKLGDLKLGDRVTVCRTQFLSDSIVVLPKVEWGSGRRTKKYEFSSILDTDLAQIIGFIEGDGSLVTDGVKLCFSKFEPEVEEFYVDLFSRRLGIPISKRCEGKDNTIQYKFCSAPLSRWFKSLGVKSHRCEPGIDVSSWSSECQFAYVAATFDTDGSLVSQRNKDKFNLRLSMTSKSCVDNVAMILRFHGMDVHESVSCQEGRNPLYSVRVRSFNKYGLFKDCVGKYMHCQHKIDRLSRLKYDYNHKYNRWAGKDESTEVVSIQGLGKQVVFDITVGTDHTFIANGLVTHNTGRMSSGGSKGNDFFSLLNIQNIPKDEVMRYLHSGTQVGYYLSDSPLTRVPLRDGTEIEVCKVYNLITEASLIKIPEGSILCDGRIIEDLQVGDYLGNQEIIDIKVDKEKVSLVDGKLLHDKYIANGNAVAMKKTKGGMRDVFICPEGYIWISCDYASEEMKLMACFSGEQNLIQPILDGSDIHKYVATKMFGHYDPTHRTIAKTINFAANYGASGYTIGKRLGVSEQEGNDLLKKYNQALPALTRWKEEMIKEAKRKGMVFTYFGRPRALYMYYNSSDMSKHSFADRSAINSPVQGTGGDLIRIDHVKLWQKFLDDAEFSANVKYACCVHDEIDLFVKPSYLYKAISILQGIMNFKPSNFPLVINTSPSVGQTWGTQIEYDFITEDNKIHFNDLQGSLEEQQEAFRQEHQDLF